MSGKENTEKHSKQKTAFVNAPPAAAPRREDGRALEPVDWVLREELQSNYRHYEADGFVVADIAAAEFALVQAVADAAEFVPSQAVAVAEFASLKAAAESASGQVAAAAVVAESVLLQAVADHGSAADCVSD